MWTGVVRWVSRHSGPLRRRARSLATGAIAVGLAAAVSVAVAGRGHPAVQPRLLSGAAWLASARVGQLTLLDGSSAEVAAQVQVATRGDRLDVVQHGARAYAVHRTAGTIRRVDGATFELTPPATPIPDARDGLLAIAGPHALYALDAQRGVLIETDPLTLVNRGQVLPLAARIGAGAATLDGDGRLWLLDTATGDLVWLHNGERHVRRGAIQPGAGMLAIAGGDAVLIDGVRRTAAFLNPRSGAADRPTDIDLRPGDTFRVGGSPHEARIYLVASRGVLAICDLAAVACTGAVPLAARRDV